MAQGKRLYYRCRARDFGVTCPQGGVRVETIDDQVIAILMNLKPPKDWRTGLTKAMGELLGEKNLEERIQEIQAIIDRMDKRWDHGFFLSEEDYIQKRIQLQMELEQLTPVQDDELQQAADMLTNFKMHWERLEGDEEARHELIKLIVERVYICDERIVAMTLRSNYHLVLNHKTNEPTEFSVDSYRYTYGSDGSRILLLLLNSLEGPASHPRSSTVIGLNCYWFSPLFVHPIHFSAGFLLTAFAIMTRRARV